MSTSRWLAARLERGTTNPFARAAATLWAACANPVRPVALPSGGPRFVGIGGATLGGSGKTTVSGALALELRHAGVKVAVVASGYKARERAARRVAPHACARRTGDEAVALSRLLASCGVPVYVAGRRSDALALAARAEPEVVIIDGLLQSRPLAVDVSVLVLDGARPWGSGACPPSGDLRAAPHALWRAADVILWRRAGEPAAGPAGRYVLHPIELSWSAAITGARAADGTLLELSELLNRRVGLVLALARPERVERQLASHGIHPRLTVLYGDHALLPAPPPGLSERARVEAWLTSAKCATKLRAQFAGAPLFVIEQRVTLPAELVEICKSEKSAPLRRGFSARAPW